MHYLKIPEYYDIDGFITKDSNPAEEFEIYKECFPQDEDEDSIDFTIKDFEDYIYYLNEKNN